MMAKKWSVVMPVIKFVVEIDKMPGRIHQDGERIIHP